MEAKEIFERIASRYDTADRINTARLIADTIRAELTDTLEKSAMDYGCGTGLIGLELMESFKSMLFVDASVQMIEQVKQKIERARGDTARTLCSDFCTEPPQLQVDYILMVQALLHVSDHSLLLNRLYDTLNQSGHLLIVDFDKNERIKSDMVHCGFEQAELVREIKQIGFASADARTFFHGKNIFMNQDASLFILIAVK
jgi:ubiquinone/menaquinone biosynthesis C-methylase UbiE